MKAEVITQKESTSSSSLTSNNWLVLKFGGSSVGDVKHWPTITQQVELTQKKGYQPFLVLSALKNVSNLLEALLHQAITGVYPMAIEHLKEMHLTFSSQLGLDLSKELIPWFEQLSNDCQQIHQTNKITAKLHARVLSIGELLSSTIGYHYLKLRGINCQWQDARQLLVSDEKSLNTDDLWHHYTNTICVYQLDQYSTESKIHQLKNQANQVIVTQGFIAADSQHDTVLLGREGSDTSAAYFGALLQAKEIQIWTDVPGVFSCNPKDNNQARLLNHLSYLEASQMAQLGAKVLHPRALQPALDCMIPIIVKSTHLPSYTGTLINASNSKLPAIKAIVCESPVVSLIYAADKSIKQIDNLAIKTEQLISQLMTIGYDTVLNDVLTANQSQGFSLIMRYNNSDQIEPNLPQLENNLATTSLLKEIQSVANFVQLQQKMALVSIVGISDDPNWHHQVILFCQQQQHLNYTHIIESNNLGRVSLIVQQEQSLEWQQLLHKTFIEAEQFSNQFGQAWTSFY